MIEGNGYTTGGTLLALALRPDIGFQGQDGRIILYAYHLSAARNRN